MIFILISKRFLHQSFNTFYSSSKFDTLVLITDIFLMSCFDSLFEISVRILLD